MEAYVTSSLTQNQIKTKSKFSVLTSAGRGVKTFILPLILVGGFFALNVDDAYAQRSARDRADNKQQAEQPTEGRQFGAKAGGMVNEAMTVAGEEQYSAALGMLSKALALPDLNAYEKATMYQMQGSYYYELEQYGPAIQAFENAISSGGLLPKESSNLRVNIAQLLIADGKFVRGAQMLEDWNRNGGQLKPVHVEMLWQAWSQAENYRRALPWAERWFNEANPKERKHYDLLNFMYSNLNMPAKQADIAKQMINLWPQEKQLWNAWKSLLANGGREKESFEVTKMLYLGGALDTQQEFETVVQYYGYYDMPFQAARILEREMNAGKIKETPTKLVQLSDLFRQAREYKLAIPALEKAARTANTAKLYADLGEAYYKEAQCGKAETSFKKAMQLGYDQGKSWMLIASCRYDDAATETRPKCPYTAENERTLTWSTKRTAAAAAFDNVPSSSREARNARKWMGFIAGEKANLKRRCVFEANIEWQNCRDDIRRAYKSEFLDGKFTLNNEKCTKYIPRFDKKFRKGVKQSEDKTE